MANQVQIIVSAKDMASRQFKHISQAVQTATKQMDKFAASARQASVKATVALAGVATAGHYLIKAGSEAQELDNVINESFDHMAQQINKWATETGKAMQRSRYQMRSFAGNMQAVLKPMVGSTEAAAKMSQQLAQLAVDMGSFWNVADKQAFEALRSGIVGETEPLRRFGIVLTQAQLQSYALAKGITRSVESMTEAEKVNLRFQYIMERTRMVQGDAARTADSLANQVKGLRADIRNLAEEWGQRLIPAATATVKAIRSVIGWFQILDDETKQQIVAWSALGTAVLGIVSVFGVVATAMAAFMKGLLVLGGVVTVATSPITLSLLGIAGLVALVAGAWEKDWKGIRATTEQGVEWVKAAWNNLLDFFRGKETTGGAGQSMAVRQGGLISTIRDVIDSIGELVGSVKVPTFQEIIDTFKELYSTIDQDVAVGEIDTSGFREKLSEFHTWTSDKIGEVRALFDVEWSLPAVDLSRWKTSLADLKLPAIDLSGFRRSLEELDLDLFFLENELDLWVAGTFDNFKPPKLKLSELSIPELNWPEIVVPESVTEALGTLAEKVAAVAEAFKQIDLNVPDWSEYEVPESVLETFETATTNLKEFGTTAASLVPPEARDWQTWSDMVRKAVTGLSDTPWGQVVTGTEQVIKEYQAGDITLGEAIVKSLTSSIELATAGMLINLIPMPTGWKIALNIGMVAIGLIPSATWQGLKDLGATIRQKIMDGIVGIGSSERGGLRLSPLFEDMNIDIFQSIKSAGAGIRTAAEKFKISDEFSEGMGNMTYDLGYIVGEAIAAAVANIPALTEALFAASAEIAAAATHIGGQLAKLMIGPMLGGFVAGLAGFTIDLADAIVEKAKSGIVRALEKLGATEGNAKQAVDEAIPGIQGTLNQGPPGVNWGDPADWGIPQGHDGLLLPGHDGPDQFLAMLAPGEAVVPSRAVRRGAAGVLEWFKKMGVPGFASGKAPEIPGLAAAQETATWMKDIFKDIGDTMVVGFAKLFDALLPVLERIAVSIVGEDAVQAVKRAFATARENIVKLFGTTTQGGSGRENSAAKRAAAADRRALKYEAGITPGAMTFGQWWSDTWEVFTTAIEDQQDSVEELANIVGRFNKEAADSISNFQDIVETIKSIPDMATDIRKGFEGIREEISAALGGGRLGNIAGMLGGAYVGWNSFSGGSTGTNWLGGIAGVLSGAGIGGPWSAGIAAASQLVNAIFPGKPKNQSDQQLQQQIKEYNRILAEWGASYRSANVSFRKDAGFLGWRNIFGNVKWHTVGKEAAQRGAQIAEQLIAAMQQTFQTLQSSLWNIIFDGGTIDDLMQNVGRQIQNGLFQYLMTSDSSLLGQTMKQLSAKIAEAYSDGIFTDEESQKIKELTAQAAEYAKLYQGAAADVAAEFGLAEEAAQGIAGALRNVPSGFKIALAEFSAARGIPAMASGGYVPPRPGGTIVRLAEAGEGEWVVPESRIGGSTVINIHVHGDVNDWDSFKRKVAKAGTEIKRDLGLAGYGLAGVTV